MVHSYNLMKITQGLISHFSRLSSISRSFVFVDISLTAILFLEKETAENSLPVLHNLSSAFFGPTGVRYDITHNRYSR